MAFSETLASRIRDVIVSERDITEKKMFGGIAFMLNGHMFAGIVGDDLMLRIGKDGYDDALKRAHVRPMDFTGRPMQGFIYVGPAGIKTRGALKSWIDKAAAYARACPPKKPKKSPAPGVKKSRVRKAS